jgi:hypothetical protein
MANGKDALTYTLLNHNFSSIGFYSEEIKDYWTNMIPDISKILIDENIENPAQRVELFFADKKYYSKKNSPQVIILNKSITPENSAEIILEVSSGEDCGRLISISHTIAQRFSMPIYLVISNKCLQEYLKFKPEHIPLPPKYVIRDKSWKPDVVFPSHPALNFKRISYGKSKGPRDQAKLLIISHGENSVLINQMISSSKLKDNIRHLELQTLRPISNEILNQAMESVKKTISLADTNIWLEQNDDIESVLINQINEFLN